VQLHFSEESTVDGLVPVLQVLSVKKVAAIGAGPDRYRSVSKPAPYEKILVLAIHRPAQRHRLLWHPETRSGGDG
jgi:hypothetical protein